MTTKKSSTTTSPGPATDATTGPLTAPVPTKTRKPRKSKSTGLIYYTARLSDSKYRIIKANSAEQVSAMIVTVTPSLPEDYLQAGRDGVTLEDITPITTA